MANMTLVLGVVTLILAATSSVHTSSAISMARAVAASSPTTLATISIVWTSYAHRMATGALLA